MVAREARMKCFLGAILGCDRVVVRGHVENYRTIEACLSQASYGLFGGWTHPHRWPSRGLHQSPVEYSYGAADSKNVLHPSEQADSASCAVDHVGEEYEVSPMAWQFDSLSPVCLQLML